MEKVKYALIQFIIMPFCCAIFGVIMALGIQRLWQLLMLRWH